MSQSSLPPEIRQLPIPERLHLAEQIWDSIAEDEKLFQLSDAQKAELDRRLVSLRDAPDAGSSWDDVKKRLLGN